MQSGEEYDPGWLSTHHRFALNLAHCHCFEPELDDKKPFLHLNIADKCAK